MIIKERHLLAFLLLFSALLCACVAVNDCPLSGLHLNTSVGSVTPTTPELLNILEQLHLQPCEFHLLDPEKPELNVQHLIEISHRAIAQYIVPSFPSTSYAFPCPDLGAVLSGLPTQKTTHKFQAKGVRELDTTFYENYFSYDVLLQKYEDLQSRYAPNLKLLSYGKTLEGRDLKAVLYKSDFKCTNPNTVLMNALQHSREWATTSSAFYVIEKLAVDNNLPHCVQVLIVGISNPDGYVFTKDGDRLWRKNRRPGSPCYGVDMNRNWDVDYGGNFSTSDFTCSNEFVGEHAFSEPETIALRDLFIKYKPCAHIDLHSFTQDIIAAYQFSSADVPHYQLLDAVAHKFQMVMSDKYRYSRGAEDTLLYKASGFMSDWSYSVGALSYLVEVYPTKGNTSCFSDAFFPETEHILPIAKDVKSAIDVLIEYAQIIPYPGNLTLLDESIDPTILGQLKKNKFARLDRGTKQVAVVFGWIFLSILSILFVTYFVVKNQLKPHAVAESRSLLG